MDFSSPSGEPGHNLFSPTANLGAKGLSPEDEAARLAALRLSSRQERIAREEEQARDLTGQRLAETSKYSPALLTAANPSLPTAATSPPLARCEDFPFPQFQSQAAVAGSASTDAPPRAQAALPAATPVDSGRVVPVPQSSLSQDRASDSNSLCAASERFAVREIPPFGQTAPVGLARNSERAARAQRSSAPTPEVAPTGVRSSARQAALARPGSSRRSSSVTTEFGPTALASSQPHATSRALALNNKP